MKLTELEPHWVGAGGEGVTHDGQPMARREGVGVEFNCPCGCNEPLFVAFKNPLDGGPPYGAPTWQRTGETFETLTLSPSILRKGKGCGWHGLVTNGEIVNA